MPHLQFLGTKNIYIYYIWHVYLSSVKANVTLSHPYCVPDSLTDAPDSIMRQTMLEGSGLILTSWVSVTCTYIKVHRLPPPLVMWPRSNQQPYTRQPHSHWASDKLVNYNIHHVTDNLRMNLLTYRGTRQSFQRVPLWRHWPEVAVLLHAILPCLMGFVMNGGKFFFSTCQAKLTQHSL